MYIVHSMRTEHDTKSNIPGPENSTAYYGVIENQICSPFIEIFITPDTFKWKKPKTEDKPETPTPIVTQHEESNVSTAVQKQSSQEISTNCTKQLNREPKQSNPLLRPKTTRKMKRRNHTSKD
jgi:hypothetical protein